jgi:phosphate:Na+ symporter
MLQLENPVKGAGIGAVLTLIIQSSSATVGMVITLGKKALITLPAGIAVMLGAELGTCSDTLLATIRSDRQALKAGLFHLIFNFSSICIGLLIFPYYVAFITTISSGASIEQQIANAHMVFNTGGVLLFLPFVPFFEKLLNKWLPEKGKEKTKVTEMAV